MKTISDYFSAARNFFGWSRISEKMNSEWQQSLGLPDEPTYMIAAIHSVIKFRLNFEEKATLARDPNLAVASRNLKADRNRDTAADYIYAIMNHRPKDAALQKIARNILREAGVPMRAPAAVLSHSYPKASLH